MTLIPYTTLFRSCRTSLRRRLRSRRPASRWATCGTPASATAPPCTIRQGTGSSSTIGTRPMSRPDALAAYEALPIPDTTEEHWRFTDLRGFDPSQFRDGTSYRDGSVTTMLDLDVAGYATVTADGIDISRAPEGVAFEP